MKTIIVTTLTALVFTTPLAQAQEQTQEQVQEQTLQMKRGSELISPQERAEHRATLREKETVQERERYREEKHEEMKERAREQGVTLPDEPMQQRNGGMMQPPRDGSGRGMGGR